MFIKKTEPWKETIVDKGEKSDTAGRLKIVAKYIDNEVFCYPKDTLRYKENLEALWKVNRVPWKHW